MFISFKTPKTGQKAVKREGMQWGVVKPDSKERESHFSLELWLIRPSEFFGARRKVVLRGEGNAWAPVSWSFEKLREVGVLSYLFYS